MGKRTTVSAQSGYTASDLQVLDGLDAVRKRPGMYIGSTDSRGLQHLVWELVDNAVDEALAGHCTEIGVVLHPDDSVEVSDNGRGIPTDINPQTGLSGVELVFVKLHAGGKFGSSGYKVAGGLHGVGASVVNALSSRLEVAVVRDGTVSRMVFREGVAGTETKGRFTPGHRLVTGKAAKGTAGTTVRFWPDRNLFLPDAVVDVTQVWSRAEKTAHLVPGLTLTVTDLREGHSHEPRRFHSKRGLVDLVEKSAAGTLVAPPFHVTGSGVFTETVPVLDGGKMVTREVEREMEVDVVVAWTTGFETDVRSFVNIVSTPKGGTHVVGFERAVTKAVGEWVRSVKSIRSGDESPVKDDVLEGMVAAVSVRFPEPQFEGQTKEVLGTAAAQKIVAQVVGDGLAALLSARGMRKHCKAVADKVAAAAQTRRKLRQQRETIRRKSALESGSLPAKLADCRATVRDDTELILVEGDSAMGSGKAARDASFQALLPLRGKILNTFRRSEKEMLDNAECAAIVSAVGAGSGRTFDLDQIRYGRIVILTDADVDGSHIRCLLLTLFWRYMRPLVEAGRVFAAVPPLYQLVFSGDKTPVYVFSDTERDQVIAAEKVRGRSLRDVQRFKGLGEMDAAQLAHTTLDRSKRTLRRITAEDAEEAAEMFRVLMGEDVAARRDYIVEHALAVDAGAVDA